MTTTAVALACSEPHLLPEVLEFLPLSPEQRGKAAILWLVVMLKSEIRTVERLAAAHEEARHMEMDEDDFVSVLVSAHVRPGLEFINEYLKSLPSDTITARMILNAIYARNVVMLTHWRTVSPSISMSELRELIEHQAKIHAQPVEARQTNALEALRLGTAIIINKNPK